MADAQDLKLLKCRFLDVPFHFLPHNKTIVFTVRNSLSLVFSRRNIFTTKVAQKVAQKIERNA
jgi:hypothetical protein